MDERMDRRVDSGQMASHRQKPESKGKGGSGVKGSSKVLRMKGRPEATQATSFNNLLPAGTCGHRGRPPRGSSPGRGRNGGLSASNEGGFWPRRSL